MRGIRVPLILLCAALAGLLPGAAGADKLEIPTGPGLPANVLTANFGRQLLEYPVLNAEGEQIGTTQWRVVRGSGNCCENHLGATASGRLIDFGGNYLNYSDNLGQNWKQVRPQTPFLGAEGTVSVAPNGDIVSVTWDPYTGDRVVAFKMDAKTEAWTYSENVLHTPFFDREWVSVIGRPLLPKNSKVPYMTVLRGGWPSKDVWYYSLDGLTYVAAGTKASRAGAAQKQAWLPTKAVPSSDWTQPISSSSLTPLPGGGALASQADLLDGFVSPGWSWWDSATFRWVPYRLGDGSQLDSGRLAIDSQGRAHLVSASGNQVRYQLSNDGGRTWSSTEVSLPGNATVEESDFRANGADEETIVGIHAHKPTGTDQDFVVEFSTTCDKPTHTRTYMVGKGDLNAASGLGAAIRFDFATVALLPGGRAATSFMDSGHTTPAVAIELDTKLFPDVEEPDISCD